jgi:PhzF family phenazine biosynthesis protein
VTRSTTDIAELAAFPVSARVNRIIGQVIRLADGPSTTDTGPRHRTGRAPAAGTATLEESPMTATSAYRPSQDGSPTVHRLAAFTDRPEGGNPAGVVITDDPLPDLDMLAIAAEVGYSETAFLVPGQGPNARRYLTRYFSPEAEVSFCGHATIAGAILLGTTIGPDTYIFDTGQGPVSVEVRSTSGRLSATLTSVLPQVEDAGDDLVDDTLAALHWSRSRLDPAFVPAVAYAGARHLVLMVRSRAMLADVDYDFERLRRTMSHDDLTTVALVYREHATRFHARNLFPPGGVVEDPATGAAAAAFGAYLRHRAGVSPPVTIDIEQGADMGRPSQLQVHIPTGDTGIEVSGTAVALSA